MKKTPPTQRTMAVIPPNAPKKKPAAVENTSSFDIAFD